MTEIVFLPSFARCKLWRHASIGGMIVMSSPEVSCSGRYFSTSLMMFASCARCGVSQNTAGSPDALARVTASFTQSRMGASLV